MARATAAIGSLFLCAILFAGPSLAANAESVPAPSKSDELVDALFTNMKAQDYSAAWDMFDPTMRAAVSPEKLKAVWTTQISSLGPLRSWSITKRSQAPGRDLRAAVLKFERGELNSTISIDPQKQLIASFFLRPAAAPFQKAPYVDAAKFHAVEVSVGSAPFVLGGTLTLPTILDRAPAAILVHGSGPQDRDETIGANKVFADLAEGLASRGIAVLRYDKRTFQYGAALGDTISLDDEVTRDAVSAMAVLRGRPEVDPDRIFVIGHSMGAMLAPEIAMRAAPVAGMVLLAPPGRPPWDIVLDQMRYLSTPKKDLEEVEAKVSRLKSGTLGNDRLLGAPQSYWKDLAAVDGIGTAKKQGRPILILRGDRDYQIIEEDIESWRKGLAGVPNVQIVTISGANHLFVPGKGKPGPSEYELPGHVDPRVIESVATFISSSTAKR